MADGTVAPSMGDDGEEAAQLKALADLALKSPEQYSTRFLVKLQATKKAVQEIVVNQVSPAAVSMIRENNTKLRVQGIERAVRAAEACRNHGTACVAKNMLNRASDEGVPIPDILKQRVVAAASNSAWS